MDYAGQTLDGRYRVLRLLGKGGMGSVYLGQHVIIGKKIAIKFLHTEHTAQPDMVKRFIREAQAASAVKHINIIDVSDVGLSSSKEPYLVMEYLEGESLGQLLNRTGPLSLSASCAIIEQVLQGLGAAHEVGIIHRDLKPENIFLAHRSNTAVTVKLIDFGISKITEQDPSELTHTGTILGTAAYMAPEQIRCERDLDHRADLFAVGVILYEMLTGALPFKGVNFQSMIACVLTDTPVPPKVAYAEFPDEAESLVMALLSKERDERPSSCAVVLKTLQAMTNFEKRCSQLDKYITGTTKRTFAAGDLGAFQKDESNDTALFEDFSARSHQALPTSWAMSKVTFGATGRRRTTRIVLFAVVLLGVVGTLIYSLRPESDQIPIQRSDSTQSASVRRVPVSPLPSEPETVRIELKNLPNGAIINYGGINMSTPSFSAAASLAPTVLKVSAPGFEDYVLKIVPRQDQIIRPTLVPVQLATADGEKNTVKAKAEVKDTPSNHDDEANKRPPPGRQSDHVPRRLQRGLLKSGNTTLTDRFDE